jgi:Rrf2 family protein
VKISTKGRYALRLMLDLATCDPSSFTTIKSISQRQDISEKYLEQIITQLNKAHFVQSARGAQGGYKLSKAPKDITVGAVLRVMEGSLAPVSCLENGHVDCSRASNCVTLVLWKEIQDAVDKIVDNTTLADLIHKQKALTK